MIKVVVIFIGMLSMMTMSNITLADCTKWHPHHCNSPLPPLDLGSGDCAAARILDPGGYRVIEVGYRQAAQQGLIRSKNECHRLADGHADLARKVCSGIGDGPWCYLSELTRKQGHCVCKKLSFYRPTNGPENGLYAIQAQTPGGWEYLHVAYNKEHGNVAVFHNQHGPSARWRLTKQSDGLYAIETKTPEGWEYLHVAHDKEHGNVAVFHNQHGSSARWKLSKQSNGLYAIETQTPGGWEYLHVVHNKEHGNVAVFHNQHGKNARWKLIKTN